MVPVRNEERDLEPAVRRLRAFLDDSFPFAARITIADNGSTDGTWAQALELAAEFPLVRAVHIERPGRGGALRTIWTGSDADIYAYMDVDLSTDLNALLPLVAPLLSGHSDVAIGTRLARGRPGDPRPEARDHFPLLQPAAPRVPRHALLRRAVRVQGDPRGRGPGSAAAHHGHGLVLRHRTARAGGAGRAAHSRGPGGLDRRRRLPGQRDGHRPGRCARDRAARHRAGPRHDQGPALRSADLRPPGDGRRASARAAARGHQAAGSPAS